MELFNEGCENIGVLRYPGVSWGILGCPGIIRLAGARLFRVSRLTATDRNEPKRTGPKRTYENTETDFYGYRNGLQWVLKSENGPEQTSAHTEKKFSGNQKR